MELPFSAFSTKQFVLRVLLGLIFFQTMVVNPVYSQNLYTPAASFDVDDHIVSTSFFIWYASNGGQLSGPWLPLEGRENWTGLTPWWKTQIKQVMMANIDQINVHLFEDPGTEIRRELLFQALSELRAEGYNVPKVAPFFDALVSYPSNTGVSKIDLNTPAGKATVTDQYIKFYNQYFTRNTDQYAADYLAKIDNKLVLDTWHFFVNYDNIPSFSRADMETPLQSAFAATYPVFNNGVYMITTALNPPFLSFTDERIAQFEVNDYYRYVDYNGLQTVQMKAGYWDQNVRTPGSFEARNGGTHYTNAWNSITPDVDRVYIESWNEYDEGTGIYAGDIGAPYIKPGSGNTNTDTWSATNDPYEYILTTAAGAAAFNETPALDAKILAHNFPTGMGINSSTIVSFTVRNEGDESWTGAADFKFRQVTTDATSFNATPVVIDDSTNEIPIYKGIFRGRPIKFDVFIKAPATVGTFTTHWQMYKGDTPFGEVLTIMMDTGCSNDINFQNVPVGFSTQFNAKNTIILDNVTVLSPAEFTLVAQDVTLTNQTTVNIGGGLQVVSEDGCQ